MATQYTQANRFFRVDTTLGPDKLLLEGFSGQERMSQPFQFTLELVAQDSAIDPLGLLRTPVTIWLRLPDGSDRPFHGL